MARVVKSIVYLVSFTTFGYVLMKLTEPTEQKLKETYGSRYKDPESRRRTELILKKLKEASDRKDPVYLQKKSNETNISHSEENHQPTKREIN